MPIPFAIPPRETLPLAIMTRLVAIARLLIAIPPFLVALCVLGNLMIVGGLFTRRFHPALFRAWARVTIWVAGLRLTVDGRNHIDPGRQYIFVCNHQSLLDIPIVTASLPQPPRFVAKSSLDRIPFFSAIMRQLGTITIDRANHREAMERLRDAQRSLARHRDAIVFFAEGTRTKDGEIGPFKKGAVMTALSLQVPIVPIALAGAFEALPRGRFALHPGPARVAIGAPIEVGSDTPEEKDRLMRLVQTRVGELYEGIRHNLTDTPPDDATDDALKAA